MFDDLQISSNTIKQHQTGWPNGKIFGHPTIFDAVWSPNISRLARPLAATPLLISNTKCAILPISSNKVGARVSASDVEVGENSKGTPVIYMLIKI